MAKSKKKKGKKRNPNKPRKTVYTYGPFSAPIIKPDRLSSYKGLCSIAELMISNTFFVNQTDITIQDERVEYFSSMKSTGKDWNDPGMVGNSIARCISMINKSCKENKVHINFRCEYKDHIYRVSSLNRGFLHTLGVDIEGLFIARYNEHENMAECFCLGTDGIKTGFYGETMIFISPDPSIAAEAAKIYYDSYKGISNYHFAPYVLAAIIEEITKHLDVDTLKPLHEHHHSGRLEVDIQKSIFRNRKKMGDVPYIYIDSVSKRHPTYLKRKECDPKLMDDVYEVGEGNDVCYPLLDMSEREIRYIHNYFQSYTDQVDIKSLFINPRYGNKLRIEHVDENGDVRKILIKVDVIGDDLARVIIGTNMNDGYNAYAIVYLYNIDDYMNPAHNIYGFNIVLEIFGENGFLEDFFVPLKELHYGGTDDDADRFEEDMYRLVHYLVKMYLVMHDRPKRYRMISVTKDPEDRPALYDPKKKKDNEEDDPKPYIIRRLLRPAKDAEEYVRQNNKNRKEVVYTMESWHRCGYWRRTKSGGKAYVPPTTCHRNLKVTKNTDIHIKL